MPSGEAAPPPSAATIAWNWVVEELADCKEFDSSIFAALMRWDWSTVADPVYGGRTMERLVLKYLEELGDSTEFLPLLSLLKSAAATPDPGSKVLDHGIDVPPSSEGIPCLNSQEVGGLNSTGNCINESCRNVLRQIILQKRAALPKSSLDLVKDLILEDCCQGASSSSKFSCFVRGDKRDTLHGDNADGHEIASKKLKLNNSHIQQVKLLSAISSETTQNLPLKEATSRHENQLTKQNVQIGLNDNNACSTKKNFAPEFPVEKNKMLQSSSPMKTGNNIEFPDVSSHGGQKVLSESSSEGEGFYDAAPDFHPSDEIIAAETLKLLNSQNPVNNDSQRGDWTQQRSCIKCDEGGQVLICTGNGCPIAVHESCLGSSVDIENPEEFKCPFCSYLLAASAYYEARKKVSIGRKKLSSFMGWGRMGLKKVPLPTLTRELSHTRNSLNGNHPDKACANQRSEIIKEPGRQNQAKAAIDGDNGNLPAEQGHNLMDRNNDAAPPSGETEIVNEFHVVSKSQHQEHAVAATISDGHAQHKVALDKEKNRADGHRHSTKVAIHHLPRECKSVVANKLCHADAGTSQIMETDKGSPSPETGDSEPSDRPSSLEHAQGLKHQQKVGTESDTMRLSCQEIHVECEKVIAIENDVDQQHSSNSREHSSPSKGRKHKISARHSKRYTNPMFPYTRRNRLPWTCEEEAILKEAMQRFYQNGETNISWIKIWEFGRHIFHKTRQPVDLKDKWRNIRMREGENWKRKSKHIDDES